MDGATVCNTYIRLAIIMGVCIQCMIPWVEFTRTNINLLPCTDWSTVPYILEVSYVL